MLSWEDLRGYIDDLESQGLCFRILYQTQRRFGLFGICDGNFEMKRFRIQMTFQMSLLLLKSLQRCPRSSIGKMWVL